MASSCSVAKMCIRDSLELGPQHWGAYRLGKDGRPQRALTGGSASVIIRHAAGVQRVHLQYVTQGDDGAVVRALDGSLLAELPPAAGGNEVVIALPSAGDGEEAGFNLQPLDGATVYIQQIRLQP